VASPPNADSHCLADPMRDYFIRRLLLIPPTLVGITIIVFFITRIVPGGPIERALAEARQADMMSGRGGAAVGAGTPLSEQQIQQLREYYGFDKPWHISYVHWLGQVARGDLGRSYIYHEPVWTVIRSKFPISIYFGVLTVFFTYAVCIPLGIVKAIRHRTWLDNTSSIIIFAGYAIPNYVLGSILVLIFAAHLEWFPLTGLSAAHFRYDSLDAVLSLLHQTTLPLVCYLVSSFAFTTLLMKNNLMDHLAADYMRTAVAKGVAFRKAVLKHAFRNSVIPVATTFGQNIGLILTGSFLIEVIFDIDGFGLLGFNSIVNRDYPVVMGILLISSILLLIGNILSDLLVALIDPRIRFR
jgi:microcin C transport system permease protein